MIMGGKANQHLLKDYVTEDDKKEFVMGHTNLCAFWIRPFSGDPAPDDDETASNSKKRIIVGSTVRYAFSGGMPAVTFPSWCKILWGQDQLSIQSLVFLTMSKCKRTKIIQRRKATAG
jgi:hypothetical protein